MTIANLNTADIVGALLSAFGADDVTGIPMPRLVRSVMAEPDLLVRYAELLLDDEHMIAEARRVSRCVTAGLEPDTVDGARWFLPGTVAP